VRRLSWGLIYTYPNNGLHSLKLLSIMNYTKQHNMPPSIVGDDKNHTWRRAYLIMEGMCSHRLKCHLQVLVIPLTLGKVRVLQNIQPEDLLSNDRAEGCSLHKQVWGLYIPSTVAPRALISAPRLYYYAICSATSVHYFVLVRVTHVLDGFSTQTLLMWKFSHCCPWNNNSTIQVAVS
jgi:hypothetical protein